MHYVLVLTFFLFCFPLTSLVHVASGPVYVQSQMKTVLSLWHGVFPHSHKELTTELKGGSMTSWIKLLDMRAGALSCKHTHKHMHYAYTQACTSCVHLRVKQTMVTSVAVCGFLSCCSGMISPNLTKRVMLPLDSALAMTAGWVT